MDGWWWPEEEERKRRRGGERGTRLSRRAQFLRSSGRENATCSRAGDEGGSVRFVCSAWLAWTGKDGAGGLCSQLPQCPMPMPNASHPGGEWARLPLVVLLPTLDTTRTGKARSSWGPRGPRGWDSDIAGPTGGGVRYCRYLRRSREKKKKGWEGYRQIWQPLARFPVP